MKIGVWLPIWPLSEWKYEGLTRLLGFVFSGIDAQQDDTYTLVLPYWVADEDIEEFLGKFTSEQRKKITVQRSGNRNIILSVALFVMVYYKNAARKEEKMRRKKKVLFIFQSKKRKKRTLTIAGSMRYSVSSIFLMAVMAVLAVPIGLVALVGAVLYKSISFVFKRLVQPFRNGNNHQKPIFSLRSNILQLIRNLLGTGNLAEFVQNLTAAELQRTALSAGRRIKVDCWYVPHIGFHSGIYLKKPRIFLFADFVFHDAPTGFSPDAVRKIKGNFAQALTSAQHVIAISNHVAKHHIKGVFNYPEQQTTTVQHGFIDISVHLPFLQGKRQDSRHALIKVIKTKDSLYQSAQIIKHGLRRIHQKNHHHFGPKYKEFIYPYLRRINFAKTRYILVSTQNRPYKNTLTAIKAVEIYNRTADHPLKLIMTGESGIDTNGDMIGDYINKQGLYHDVLSIARVPDKVHAALYHCADLAVAASFFEGGGGSFVFDEAVSVGTPTLLSINHSHNEGFARFESFKLFSFNPNSPKELASLIDRVFTDGLNSLYSKQWELAQKRALNRSWTHAQQDYINVFETVARMENDAK